MRSLILIACSLGILAGSQGGTSDLQAEPNAYLARNEGITPRITQTVREGRITLSMTTDEVRLSLGSPDDVRDAASRFGIAEVWSYRYPTVTLHFSNSVLEYWAMGS